jgi:hypothetical protein
MAMVTGCQWDGATLALKSQQPVMTKNDCIAIINLTAEGPFPIKK